MASRPNVYIHCDETGQQTKGRSFVVATVALTGYRNDVERQLAEIEKSSGKHHRDWRTCATRRLESYLDEALKVPELRDAVFYRVYEDIAPSSYRHKAAETMLSVGQHFQPKKAILIPEGFARADRKGLEQAARRQFNNAEVWAGGFDRYAIVRLTDALAGLIFQARFNQQSPKYFPESVKDWFRCL